MCVCVCLPVSLTHAHSLSLSHPTTDTQETLGNTAYTRAFTLYLFLPTDRGSPAAKAATPM